MTEDDKALLTKAAEAAGLIIAMDCEGEEIVPRYYCMSPNSGAFEWNPLADDGDALRLAVKLQISPMYGTPCVAVCAFSRGVSDDKDQYAATRRAIVRAAAATLRGKENA